MPTNAEFGQRAREARRLWSLAHDAELTYGEIGQLVADAMGRDGPFSHQAVRRWFVEGQEPDSFATTAALAQVLAVPPEWLAFGIGAPSAERPATERPKGEPMPVGVAKPRPAKGAAAKGARRRSNG